MKPCYIFDIDGTVADIQHRLHFIDIGNYSATAAKDWDAFFEAAYKDTPIPPVIEVCRKLSIFTPIVFATGRSERVRADTSEWLKLHKLDFHALYMRTNGDHRDDDIVKRDMLQQILADGWQPLMAFDDRTRVVDMWRANGIHCAQVAPGDY